MSRVVNACRTLGGGADPINFVPQQAASNQFMQGPLETMLAGLRTFRGCEFDVQIQYHWPNTRLTRPTEILYQVKLGNACLGRNNVGRLIVDLPLDA